MYTKYSTVQKIPKKTTLSFCIWKRCIPVYTIVYWCKLVYTNKCTLVYTMQCTRATICSSRQCEARCSQQSFVNCKAWTLHFFLHFKHHWVKVFSRDDDIQMTLHDIQVSLHGIQKSLNDIQKSLHNIQMSLHYIQESLNNIQFVNWCFPALCCSAEQNYSLFKFLL